MHSPTLNEMGIVNPTQISRYRLRQKGPRKDELTISYQRKKGSLLPVSRTYEFGRSQNSVIIDSGTPEYRTESDPSPTLQSAIRELDELLADNRLHQE